MTLKTSTMNKILISITFILLSFTNGYSQQLICTAGAQQNNVSWSIGELVTNSGTTSEFIFNQGFNSFSDVETSLSDIDMSSTIEVYPNPVIDKLFLKFTESNNYSYILTDIVGHVLLNNTVNSNQEIDLSNYKAGQYILRVYSNQFSKSTIIIKK